VQSEGLDWMAPTSEASRDDPAFALVVPVWNTDPDHLTAMVASVRAQRHRAWTMVLADDASTRGDTIHVLDALGADPRIRVVRLERNSGIVAATSAALMHADAEWVAFADHDDLLHPDALTDVARLVREAPELEFVYTDSDRVGANDQTLDTSYKSAWSPDLLRSTNCIVHLCCYRRSLVERLGGLREGFDGSQDYDLLLRVGDAVDSAHIGHVARPRYHWRAAGRSVAADPAAKLWAYDAAVRALTESLRRRGLRGRVDRHDVLGWYHTRYEIPTGMRATIIVFGEEGSARQRTRAALAGPVGAHTAVAEVVEVQRADEAVARAASLETELVAFVCAGVIPSEGWLDALAEHAARAEVGIVGCTVVDDASVPAFGLVVGGTQGVRPATPDVNPGDFAWSGRVVRNLSAVPLLVAATRPAVLRTSGWDADLDGDALAADLGLRIRARGLHVVTTPHANAVQLRRHVTHASTDSIRRFRARWDLGVAGDPFVNPNLAWCPDGDQVRSANRMTRMFNQLADRFRTSDR
jgi:glycosyltransferase involved in cell wall biosynthesis